MKLIEKSLIKKTKHKETFQMERKILEVVDHPFVTKLRYAF